MAWILLLVTIVVAAFLCWRFHERLRIQERRVARLNKMLEAEICDRRATERELAHVASFAEIDPNPIVEVNADGRLGYCNPKALQEFPELGGLAPEHPVIQGLSEVMDLMKAARQSIYHRTVTVDDHIYDEQVSLIDEGTAVRLYLSDITELKRLDQLKSDLINIVSHELRSPLTSIYASLRMVESQIYGPINDEQQRAMGLAVTNIDRLMRLINNLLDISKIEAGKLDLEKKPTDLRKVIEEVRETFRPLATERGIELRSRSNLDTIVRNVDRDKITQVLTNLVQNALKFTEEGFVEISLDAQASALHIIVADSGRGIPKSSLGRVFGKFEQFGSRPLGVERGTGLGLSLCKGIVELHGGTIRVESEEKKGTKFIIEMPCEVEARGLAA